MGNLPDRIMIGPGKCQQHFVCLLPADLLDQIARAGLQRRVMRRWRRDGLALDAPGGANLAGDLGGNRLTILRQNHNAVSPLRRWPARANGQT
jgi:hypothetical protein